MLAKLAANFFGDPKSTLYGLIGCLAQIAIGYAALLNAGVTDWKCYGAIAMSGLGTFLKGAISKDALPGLAPIGSSPVDPLVAQAIHQATASLVSQIGQITVGAAVQTQKEITDEKAALPNAAVPSLA